MVALHYLVEGLFLLQLQLRRHALVHLVLHLLLHFPLLPIDLALLRQDDGIGELVSVLLVVVAVATPALVVAQEALVKADAVLLHALRFLASAEEFAVGRFLLEQHFAGSLADLDIQFDCTFADASLFRALDSPRVLFAHFGGRLHVVQFLSLIIGVAHLLAERAAFTTLYYFADFIVGH
jgi:hypothetical protein